MSSRGPKLTACALFLVSLCSVAQPGSEEPDRNAHPEEPDWAVAVVKLGYADAAEVALLLSRVLPATVRVVAYEPTNSLIIAGDPRIVGGLGQDGARDDEGRPGATHDE
jgi:type II secretory pathway component GspD/PulD (secretin)